jgi:flagellar hook-length control protein FliK
MALPNGIDSRSQDAQSAARAAANRGAQSARNDPRNDTRGDSVSERADFSAMLDSLRELDAAPEARNGAPGAELARDGAAQGVQGVPGSDLQAAIYGSASPATPQLPVTTGGDSARGDTDGERRAGDARGAVTGSTQGGEAKPAGTGGDADGAAEDAGERTNAGPASSAASAFDLAPGADAPLPALSAEDLILINLLATTPPLQDPSAALPLVAQAAQAAPAAPAPSTASARPAQMVEIAAPVDSAGFGGEFADSMRVMARGGVHISLTGTPEARAALQDALPRLRESLAQAGIELGNTSIGTHESGQQRGQPRGQGAGQGGGWGYPGSGQADAVESALPRPGRALGLVDTYA